MRTAFYVHLPPTAISALRELASREYREPRDQAAVLVLEGLLRAGVAEESTTDLTNDLVSAGVAGT